MAWRRPTEVQGSRTLSTDGLARNEGTDYARSRMNLAAVDQRTRRELFTLWPVAHTASNKGRVL